VVELGWLGFSCVQGKARLGLVGFGIRSGLGSGQVWSSHVWLHLGPSEVGLVVVQISQD
jgi:hypothetical protein